MNITVENTGELTAEMKIEIQQQDYQAEVEKAISKHRREAKVPGFRPGKVPKGMIQKLYGEAIIAEEVQQLMSKSMGEYIQENKLDIIGSPLTNREKSGNIDFKKVDDFTFFFDIAYRPEIKTDVINGLEVDHYQIKVDEKVINDSVKNIQERFGTYDKVDIAGEKSVLRGIAEELNEQNEVRENGVKNEKAFIDSYYFDKEKTDFLGKKVCDILEFYPHEALTETSKVSIFLGIEKEAADQNKSKFRFTVNEIEDMTPASVNKELYKKAYPHEKINNKEEFQKKIEEDISKSYEKESDRSLLDQMILNILEKGNVNLPDEFMKRWLYEQNEGKVPQEEINNSYGTYAKSMKWDLFENQLVRENEDLKVTDDDIKAHLKSYLQLQFQGEQNEQMQSFMDNYADQMMQNKEETDKVRNELFSQKLIEFFKSKVKLNTKKVSTEEFIKLASERAEESNKVEDNK